MKGTRGENEEKKKGTLKEMNEPYAEYCTYFGFHGTDEIDPKGPCHIYIYIYICYAKGPCKRFIQNDLSSQEPSLR